LNELKLLQLFQLADSALPTGALSHSFGLESLIEEGSLTVDGLEAFLNDYLQETGLLEANFCRQAYHLTDSGSDQARLNPAWSSLNAQISAFKPPREARLGSLSLGRRLAHLALQLEELPLLRGTATVRGQDMHYCAVFGLLGGLLEVDEEAVVLAYLQQTTGSLISACQRLMALGQGQAAQINWRLKPAMLQTATESRATWQKREAFQCFAPLTELASMRHPALRTRLFIS
jgi:urease accessory protein